MMDFQNLDAQTLAQAIVNTIPEPFIVLDHQFRVLSASVSFYQTFKVDPEDTRGRLLYSLGDGQWDIPALRVLLETIIPERAAMDGFEVEHDFPTIGRRTMLLNARQVIYEDSSETTILLAFMDVTVRRRSSGRRRTSRSRPRNCFARRMSCSRKCSTASPTAFRSSQAYCC